MLKERFQRRDFCRHIAGETRAEQPRRGRRAFAASTLSIGLVATTLLHLVQTTHAANGERFATDAIAVLRRHCVECHGRQRQEAGLRLDNREGMLAGGDSGLTLLANDPAESELLRRVGLGRDDSEAMPPVGDGLTAKEASTLQAWLAAGADWPASANTPHWAYVSPRRHTPPGPDAEAGRQAGDATIDGWVAAGHAEQGLGYAAEASRETLIRRLSFDLTGLPPSPEAVNAFLSDTSPDAYERLVDDLLASEQFGVRWARMWLDLARYADSHGYQRDDLRPLWAYRDWVVAAFNADMPFDQFTIEQIAGDLLPDASEATRIATGFHRCSPTNVEAGTDPEESRFNQVIDRVNTTAAVWLGTTLECAQCHDHKYDPFTQTDYYRLAAYFNSTESEVERANPKVPSSIKFRGPSMPLGTDPWAEERAELNEQIRLTRNALKTVREAKQVLENLAADRSERDGTRGATSDRIERDGTRGATGDRIERDGTPGATGDRIERDGTRGAGGPSKRPLCGPESRPACLPTPNTSEACLSTPDTSEAGAPAQPDTSNATTADDETIATTADDEALAEVTQSVGEIEKTLKTLEKRLADLPLAESLVMRELAEPRETFVLARGDLASPREQVSAGTPSVLPSGTADRGDRLDLARWLVDRSNPLTARVIVNRLWHEIFGRGIVTTLEDFGVKGEPPTHPELLDTLAAEFVDDGWSLKRLIRRIVLSRTYRQDARATLEERALDPDNRWLARGPRFRLDAEAIRDNALAIAGLLSLEQGGPSIRPPQPKGLWTKVGGEKYDYRVSPGESRYRRGLYVVLKRGSPYPSFVTFDATSRMTCLVKRARSNTPLQALVLLNDEVFTEAALAFARRILDEQPHADAEERIRHAVRVALARDPTSRESDVLLALLTNEQQALAAAPERAAALLMQHPHLDLPGSHAVSDLVAWYGVATVLLNLDETITKP